MKHIKVELHGPEALVTSAKLNVIEFLEYEPSNYVTDPGWVCVHKAHGIEIEYFVNEAGMVYRLPENEEAGIAPELYAESQKQIKQLNELFYEGSADRDDWPIHQPPAPEAPIPGRHWYGSCEDGWPKVKPDGTCEGCGETACTTCGCGFYPDGGCRCTERWDRERRTHPTMAEKLADTLDPDREHDDEDPPFPNDNDPED